MHGVIRAQTSHPVLVFVSAITLALLSLLFTFTNLRFETSQRALISTNNRLMQLLELADRFSGLDAFIVAVENRDTKYTLAFVRDLVPKLEAEERHFSQIFARVDPAHFRSWMLLYLSDKELMDLRDQIVEHEDMLRQIDRSPRLVTFFEEINNLMTTSMVGELFTGFLQKGEPQEKKEPMDLGFLIHVLRQMKASAEGHPAFVSPWQSLFIGEGLGDEAEEGYFWTDKKKYLLIFATPRSGSSSADALAALRDAVASTSKKFPGIEAGVTGQKALDEDEKALALKDINVATFLSLAGLALLLIIFWRTVRRPLLQLTTQVIGLSLTFGLTTLVIGHLNLLSVTFAPMVLGLGIDYDIHWFARYSEERRRPGQSTPRALEATMDEVGRAIVAAGAATALSFFPLALTGFKGLAELGTICAMGLLVANATTLCLLPALIVLFDRPKLSPPTQSARPRVRALLKLRRREAVFFLLLTSVTVGLSVWATSRIKFDLNMLNLQSQGEESVIWEKKLIEGSKYASIYGVLFAHSLEQVAEKTKALATLPTVAEVQSITKFLPTDQERKIGILREMKHFLAHIRSIPPPSGSVDIDSLEKVFSRIQFKMSDTAATESGAKKSLVAQMKEVRVLMDRLRKDFHSLDRSVLLERLGRFQQRFIQDLNDKLSLLYENVTTRPMTVSDLPRPLIDRFVGPDSLYLVRVFPSGNIWDPKVLAAFVRDLWTVDPDATGDPVTLYVFTGEFRDASVKAAFYALVFIFAFLFVSMRSVLLTVAAISPLVIGALWTFGLMHLFGIDLNLANAIFLPLIIGAGVEYGIIIVQRWRQTRQGEEHVPLPLSTGMGVILAGLTTTIGFVSLMISRHQGIHSLGLLTTIGSLSVLAAALLFLPALLYILGGRSGSSHTAAEREKIEGEDIKG